MGEQLADSLAEGHGAPKTGCICPTRSIRAARWSGARGSDWLASSVSERDKHADHIPERAAIGDALVAEAKPGDRILIMGARDDTLIDFAQDLVARMSRRN